MAESFIQVAPDSTGKRLRTYDKTINSVVVHEQFVILAGYPTYYFQTATNSGAGSSTNFHFDIFNASGSGLVLKVRKLFLQQTFVAQTGVAATFEIRRTSAVGTGGTTLTATKADTADSTFPAQVTARGNPTGGNTSAGLLTSFGMSGAETDIGGRAAMYFNMLAEGNETKDVTLREGEGLSVCKTAGTATTSGTWSVLSVVTVA